MAEDYELLFTLPLEWHDKIKELENIREIGYITALDMGALWLLAADKLH